MSLTMGDTMYDWSEHEGFVLERWDFCMKLSNHYRSSRYRLQISRRQQIWSSQFLSLNQCYQVNFHSQFLCLQKLWPLSLFLVLAEVLAFVPFSCALLNLFNFIITLFYRHTRLMLSALTNTNLTLRSSTRTTFLRVRHTSVVMWSALKVAFSDLTYQLILSLIRLHMM